MRTPLSWRKGPFAPLRQGFHPVGGLLLRALFLLTLLFAAPEPVWADSTYTDDFEQDEPGWKLIEIPKGGRVLNQQRQRKMFHHGETAEAVTLAAIRAADQFRFEYLPPAARGVEGFEASLWVRSQGVNSLLGLRVVFPRQIDPETGKPLTTLFEGDWIEQKGSWKNVKLTLTKQEFNSRIRLLRKKLEADIEWREWYVDRVFLTLEAPAGESTIQVDELELRPFVKYDGPVESSPARDEKSVLAGEIPKLDVRLDRLLIEDRPMFLRFVPHQGESPAFLQQIGFNTVWIPDVLNASNLQQFSAQHLLCMGTPPQVRNPEGKMLPASRAGIVPFSREYDRISIWMLGNGISAEERRQVASWVDQVSAADRHLGNERPQKRPMIAGVTGAERNYSRIIPLLGYSRTMQNSAMSYHGFREWLSARQKLARPGSFAWTWIQLFPDTDLNKSRKLLQQAPLALQYEQLRMQVYSSLAGGCRGLGFWSVQSLEEDAPGAVEMRLALRQLNLELELLEDWLATGELLGQTTCKVTFRNGNAVG
ncbi:MAG: hypothetical protein U0903_00700 [Planctomycetales bacterium]